MYYVVIILCMEKEVLCNLDVLMNSGNCAFCKFGRVYFQTNEELKGYINNLDNKSVLSVSASGDQLLNCVWAGATVVDTFDINYFSHLYQNLKIGAVVYLNDDDLIKYLKGFNYDIYKKFSLFLDSETRCFFDYLYSSYGLEKIKGDFFFINRFSYMNQMSFIYKNNYIDDLNKLRRQIVGLDHKHYQTDIYNLPDCLERKYDAIFLSNISSYCKNPFKFFELLQKVFKKYLNDDGKIYYAYHYDCQFFNPSMAIRSINIDFDMFQDIPKDILSKTEIVNIRGNDVKDSVLILHK